MVGELWQKQTSMNHHNVDETCRQNMSTKCVSTKRVSTKSVSTKQYGPTSVVCETSRPSVMHNNEQ